MITMQPASASALPIGLSPIAAAAWQRAQSASSADDWAEAIQGYRTVLQDAPRFVPAYLELSRACESAGLYRDAFSYAAGAAAQQPTGMLAAVTADRLRHFGQYALQRDMAQKAMADLSQWQAGALAASGIAATGQAGAAAAWLRSILPFAERSAAAWYTLGNAELALGHGQAAHDALERAIKLRQDMVPAHFLLSQMHLPDGSSRIARIRRVLRSDAIDTKSRVLLQFALHHEFDHLGEHTGAWDALVAGCRLQATLEPHNENEAEQLFQDVCTSSGLLSRRYEAMVGKIEQGSPRPILIVGMYRSGSTLLERMLAGHPQVGSAGECRSLVQALRWEADCVGPAFLDRNLVAKLARVDHGALASRYRATLSDLVPGTALVTDKTNDNYLLAAFVATVIPDAIILHTHRHPVDTCFSLLRTHFARLAPYSYDQAQLARHYQRYERLMASWREKVGDRIHDFALADIVSDPEAQAKRLCDITGIDFRSTMTTPEREGGEIATASAIRARTKFQSNHHAAWKPYEDKIAPMIDALSVDTG